MRPALIVVAVLVVLTGPAAAAKVPPLRFDPALLDRVEEHLSVVLRAAASVNVEQLPGISADSRNRMEFAKQAIVEHAADARKTISVLRRGRSMAGTFTLVRILWTIDDLLMDLSKQLFTYAGIANKPQSDSTDPTKGLDNTVKALRWATELTKSSLPLSRIPADVELAAVQIAADADAALDECGH